MVRVSGDTDNHSADGIVGACLSDGYQFVILKYTEAKASQFHFQCGLFCGILDSATVS